MNAVVLLAAGTSSRLGEPKQLLDVDGEPLVRRVARRLIDVDRGPVGVIVGANADAVRLALGGLGVAVVHNADFARGLGTSVRAAVVWAESMGATSLMIALCDQPAIEAPHFRALVDALDPEQQPGRVVPIPSDATATDYDGKAGVPAAFAQHLFARLTALPDDAGAARILRDPAVNTRLIACPEAQIDLDTPAAVAEWRSRHRGKST